MVRKNTDEDNNIKKIKVKRKSTTVKELKGRRDELVKKVKKTVEEKIVPEHHIIGHCGIAGPLLVGPMDKETTKVLLISVGIMLGVIGIIAGLVHLV